MILIITSNYSFAATFQNYKTEKEIISDGVILEKQISTSTGKIIKQIYKIKVNNNYYEAVKKDGKWQLSEAGKNALADAEKGGGGGGGC
tara:strand:- start:2022 stop:2288 length:267 start_codon:yes stop_codon:yes gene_type:complete